MINFYYNCVMEEDVFVSNGSRPLWQTIIAALLYTVSFYFVYQFFVNYNNEIVNTNPKGIASFMQTGIVLFAIALRFSLVIDYQFDIKDKRYKKIYRFGAIRYGKWTSFKNLNYVAIYTNQRDQVELNLWYNKNNHFTLSYFDDENDVKPIARSIASKLNIDFWNALDPRNGFWDK